MLNILKKGQKGTLVQFLPVAGFQLDLVVNTDFFFSHFTSTNVRGSLFGVNRVERGRSRFS